MKFHHTAAVQERYKFPGFLRVPIASLQGIAVRPLPVITTFSSPFAPFHGGNTGSSPVGDAKSFQKFKSAGSFFRRHGGDEVLRGRPRQIPWTTNIRAPTIL